MPSDPIIIAIAGVAIAIIIYGIVKNATDKNDKKPGG